MQAEEFLENLEPNTNSATVVGLIGDLGAGKTTFVQNVGRALGIADPITSPTFVIEKIYKLQQGQALMPPSKAWPCWQQLVHIDAYRLDGADDLRKLNWDELVADVGNLIMIEWADKVSAILPPDTRQLHFKFVDEYTREIIET